METVSTWKASKWSLFIKFAPICEASVQPKASNPSAMKNRNLFVVIRRMIIYLKSAKVGFFISLKSVFYLKFVGGLLPFAFYFLRSKKKKNSFIFVANFNRIDLEIEVFGIRAVCRLRPLGGTSHLHPLFVLRVRRYAAARSAHQPHLRRIRNRIFRRRNLEYGQSRRTQ